MNLSFNAYFRKIIAARQSLLCVGLDPELEKLPAHLPQNATGLVQFCEEIIAATAAHVAAFKINFAFFEALGKTGWDALARVAAALPRDVIKIADAKRGDIGNTSRLYAAAVLRELPFDALTVNPYLGEDAAAPFLENAAKGAFFLCRTSNPGSAAMQLFPQKESPLYAHVAREVQRWNRHDNAGLVVGATQPKELEIVRHLCPNLPFLIPGVGAQGGDLEIAVKLGAGATGDLAVINASRAVIYAANDKNFAEAASNAAATLRRQIQNCSTARSDLN